MEENIALLVLSNFRDATTGVLYRTGDVIEVRRSVYERMQRNGGPVEPQAGEAAAEPDEDADAKPTMDNTKAEIAAYLDAAGIAYDAKAKKADLLALIP